MDNNGYDKGPNKFDPAGETVKKLIFFAAAVIILVVLKFVLGY